MQAITRSATAAAIVACAIALAGCITINVPEITESRAPLTSAPDPGEARESTPSPPPVGDDIDCGGLPVQLQSAPGAQTLVGDCPEVTVDANDADIDLTGADVGSLTLRGDRLDVVAGDIAGLEIGGQDNALSGATIGAVTVRGDRNVVDVAGDVGAATVSGNDNAVLAPSVGAVVVSGGGNVVGPR